MPNFFRIPKNCKISQSKYYNNGLIYGMDLASGVVV